MFHSLRVTAIVEETSDAKSIVFDVPSALAGAFAYRAGQFLTVEVDCGGERLRQVTRPLDERVRHAEGGGQPLDGHPVRRPEHPLENELRIHFLGHRRRGRPPRDTRRGR